MAVPAPSQQDVGRTLRRARQRHHVRLEDAATITRIPIRYLEALEANAPIDAYPAPVYARAFLREYATYLEVDPEPLVTRFGPPPREEVHLATVGGALRPPRRWPARALVVLSVAGLLGLAVVGILSARTHVGRPGAAPPRKPVASTAPRTPSHHPPPPHRFSGITAAVHFVDRCWVSAVADGGAAIQHVFVPSQSHTFAAKHSLALTLGNAAGARIVLNGRRIPTGGPGQVVRLAIAFEKGKVHVTRA